MAVPATFAAAFNDSPGAPVRVGEHSFTSPLSADDLTIRITATAINPVDWKLRDSGAFLPSWPIIMGSDAAGEVVEVGDNFTSKFQPGERVFFQGLVGKYEMCTFQQYCRVPAHVVGKTPANVTDDEAAGVSLCSVTAAVAIYHSTGRSLTPAPWSAAEGGGSQAGKGKAVVVLGGSTSVGQYAIQFARLSGYSRIVTSASAANAEFLKTLGAHVVLDRKTQGGVQDYIAAVGDELELDWVYDCVSLDESQLLGVKIVQGAKKVTPEALVVSVDNADEKAVAAGKAAEGSGREVPVRGIYALGYYPDYRYVTEPMYEKLGEWMATGEFVPNRVKVLPGGLKAAEDGMQLNKAGVSGVKVIIRPQEAS
ncbi:chaperonin 10-like protein [Microdochium trichocladiopsis]|uniref:Chaperonin 10-like protein n=1 Tax=Microdochium trichocladiopsis TaxID=1682393 RepID=A0A9P8XST0_9PEZI|nr:chaperonin 10-like protein [Microdochium trichocladiopsis]KAH7014560.1 chaperonin 10-like protein [Microdochium trichocladiopsis]